MQATGAVTQTHNLVIQNTGGELLTWTLTEEPTAGWLTAVSTTGTIDSEAETAVFITVSRLGLVPGVYTTTLRVDAGSADNSPQSITVTFC
ncbi:MAG: hypothetical protein IPM76_08015 [Chloroflexi bacterium]|nr:hypothetical protein [Chloroflexota bacterium]